MFPFRAKSLLTLRETVGSLRGDLQLSVQIVQRYVRPLCQCGIANDISIDTPSWKVGQA